MKPLLIVKTGDTLPEIARRRGDFDDWIIDGLGIQADESLTVQVHKGEPLPDPSEVGAVVVTGSPALLTDREDWSERTAAWLPSAVRSDKLVLGICYGHQLLAHALGGVVQNNVRGREIGTVDVRLADTAGDALLADLPAVIRVQASHLQSVTLLPPGAARLGSNSADPNHVFRIGERAWGVQFHPEFDADIVRGYIAGRRSLLDDEGLDADALIRSSGDSPHGDDILARFGELAREQG